MLFSSLPGICVFLTRPDESHNASPPYCGPFSEAQAIAAQRLPERIEIEGKERKVFWDRQQSG